MFGLEPGSLSMFEFESLSVIEPTLESKLEYWLESEPSRHQ
jgi:hypothetical protein